MVIIIGCSGAKNIAKKMAARLKAQYSELEVEKFPDNELRVRFKINFYNKTVVLVQSFYENINDKVMEVLFAAYTARELKAKRVVLVAPYMAYMREDKRFESGESISARIMARLFQVFDKTYILEPHLHRFKELNNFFLNAEKISAAGKIAEYAKKLPVDVVVGPDSESEQWAGIVAQILKKKCIILKKQRLGHRNVKISEINESIKNKNALIIDDVISTGCTIVETAKKLRAKKAKKLFCIGIHGIFAENALQKLSKYVKIANIISTNSIPSKVSKIDVSDVIAKAIMAEK